MSRNVKLTEDLEFLLDLDALKDVERRNPLAKNPRPERVAEHSWHLAVASLILADDFDQRLDLGKAALLAIAHDVVERFVGDTFAFGSDVAGQSGREHRAMDDLAQRTGSPGIKRLIGLWREYEDQETPEARFVKGLDALLPILLNYHNIEFSSWRAHDVSADKVLARANNHGNMGEALRTVAVEMINDAQARGFLS